MDTNRTMNHIAMPMQSENAMSAKPGPSSEKTVIQTGLLLTKLPMEVRDKIYKHLFEDEDEHDLLHPLMQTSKQLEDEVLDHISRNIGRQSTFQIRCKSGLNGHWECCFYRYQKGGYYPRDSGLPRLAPRNTVWQRFRKTKMANVMLSRVQALYIQLSESNMQAFTIHFINDGPPKIQYHKAWKQTFGSAEDAMFRQKIKLWQSRSAKCSVTWIDEFLKDIQESWIAFVHQNSSTIHPSWRPFVEQDSRLDISGGSYANPRETSPEQSVDDSPEASKAKQVAEKAKRKRQAKLQKQYQRDVAQRGRRVARQRHACRVFLEACSAQGII